MRIPEKEYQKRLKKLLFKFPKYKIVESIDVNDGNCFGCDYYEKEIKPNPCNYCAELGYKMNGKLYTFWSKL